MLKVKIKHKQHETLPPLITVNDFGGFLLRGVKKKKKKNHFTSKSPFDTMGGGTNNLSTCFTVGRPSNLSSRLVNHLRATHKGSVDLVSEIGTHTILVESG